MWVIWVELYHFWSACCQYCPLGPHSFSRMGWELLTNELLLFSGSHGRSECLSRAHSHFLSLQPGGIPAICHSLFWNACVFIGNILIVPLISFKLHEKYKGPDQEIVTKFSFCIQGIVFHGCEETDVSHLAFGFLSRELSPSELSTSLQGCIFILPLMCLYLLLFLSLNVLFLLMDVYLYCPERVPRKCLFIRL